MSPGIVLTVHSYKGGTGKSLISTNLASILASQGRNVALLDLDLRAPSLNATFGNDGNGWVNDFLDEECEANELFKDFSKEKGTKGKLAVALANSSVDIIRETVGKDRKWEMRALHRLLSLKEYLLKESGMDYVILDTSPGPHYASINAVAVADLVLVITTCDEADAAGTRGMVGELYNLLEKRATVLLNKVPEHLLMGTKNKEKLVSQFKRAFNLPLMNLLPCYCDVLEQERSRIMALEDPKHPFSRDLVKVARRIEETGKKISPRPARRSS